MALNQAGYSPLPEPVLPNICDAIDDVLVYNN